jgi:thiosulfate dehydrogenase [quinone] large subunit
MGKNETNQVQVIALTILRVFIGWHFLYEGLAKMLKGTWSAKGFLMQSKWIFSGIFKWIASSPDVLNIVDQLNMWGLVAIGLGLILGCFTRIASYAGMSLILLYYICNPLFVGYFYSIPMEGNYLIVNKNLVEIAALFVLAVSNNGRYYGLDRLISLFFNKK